MGVGGADDDHGIDVAVGDQFLGRSIRLRHVELLRDGGGERAIDVGDGDDGRFGNARRQIADVDLAEPAAPMTPTLSFVIDSCSCS